MLLSVEKKSELHLTEYGNLTHSYIHVAILFANFL